MKKKAGTRTLLDYVAGSREQGKPASSKAAGSPQGPRERAAAAKVATWYAVSDSAFIPNAYLLSYYYDPEANKAVLAFYDADEGKVKYWYDKLGHKPYFLVKEEPEEVLKKLPASLRQRVESCERVVKKDLLRMKSVTMTKVVAKDPLAVREMRELFEESWESDIKYHQNYIYDAQLVPGFRYEVKGKNVVPKGELSKLGDDESAVLAGLSKESKLLAEELVKLLELEPPLPRAAAVDIEVYSPVATRLPDAQKALYPVLSVAIVTSDGKRLVLALDFPKAGSLEGFEPEGFELVVFDSERALLQEVFRALSEYPLVATYNGDNFDFPYLRHRAQKLGFREEEIPIAKFQDYYTLKTGIHVDLYKVFDNKALKAYAFGGGYRDSTLDSVAEALLGKGKLKLEEVVSSADLASLAKYNLRDAELILELLRWKDWLPWKLLVVLSRLAKTGIEELSRSQISTWIRNMLYWELRRRGCLIPRKEELLKVKGEARSKAVIKGKKYAGAIVLDPPLGVFFNVHVLDFASLYPSIMKVWNLSYETVNPLFECSNVREVPDVGHKVCFDREGVMSQLIGVLRDLRVKVFKKRAKAEPDKAKAAWYDVVQSSLKVFLNASYGVFGSEAFALYTPPVAESVTAVGRYVIKRTLKKAEEKGLLVLYGDTDSMFVWDPKEKAIRELVEEVERESSLDLEVDKVFKFVAFSGLKKNYLGVASSGDVVIKGLLGKKRNQPEFIKRAFEEVIKDFGSVASPKDFEEKREQVVRKIKEIYKRLRVRDFSLDELAFSVMLSKPPEKYEKVTPQHVKAALMLCSLGKTLVKGDIISFVKVKGRDGVKPVELAKLSEVDVEKYAEALKSAFEQLLQALGVEWKEVEGASKLEGFFNNNSTPASAF